MERAKKGAMGAAIVKNVICSEAAVFAHQLAFFNKQGSSDGFFIELVIGQESFLTLFLNNGTRQLI